MVPLALLIHCTSCTPWSPTSRLPRGDSRVFRQRMLRLLQNKWLLFVLNLYQHLTCH